MADQQIDLDLGPERYAYVHVAFGSLSIGATKLKSGDAVTFAGAEHLTFAASEESQILFFELA